MPQILAAGAVVARKGPEVLLVHRPKYDDWSFPKGKLEPGEHPSVAAVREVAEETGLDIRLGPPLTAQSYEVGNGARSTKIVHYWAGRVVGGDDVSTYATNEEIDAVRWMPLDKARDLLSYDYDRDTLDEFEVVRKKTYPLVVLRHAKALPRKAWDGDDRDRPLSVRGEEQSAHLVGLLGAYGVRRIVSSSSRRCWTTVTPFAASADLDVETADGLCEEDATPTSVARHVHRLLDGNEPAVLCTHRPVLPWVFEALGLEERKLEAGAMLVVHHRRGRVVATEQH